MCSLSDLCPFVSIRGYRLNRYGSVRARSSPHGIFLLVTVVKGFLSATIGLNMSLTNDLVENPAVAGTVFGVLLLGGNLFGSLAPIVTGYLVHVTGKFDSAFFLAGALVVAGSLISLLATRKPIT